MPWYIDGCFQILGPRPKRLLNTERARVGCLHLDKPASSCKTVCSINLSLMNVAQSLGSGRVHIYRVALCALLALVTVLLMDAANTFYFEWRV